MEVNEDDDGDDDADNDDAEEMGLDSDTWILIRWRLRLIRFIH